MIPQKCLHFLHRFFQMGPRTAAWLLYHRLQKRHFINTWRKKWQQQPIGSPHNFCNKILHDDEFIASLPDKFRNPESVFALANKACIPEITILGYGTFTLPLNPIPWHQDFTTPEQSPSSWQTNFFADIKIPSTHHHNQAIRYPDIKVPWELSRLQHFFTLGLGYHYAQQQHNQKKMERYSDAFLHQAISWITNNPFLQGVNWTNPMEVAIRAINLVWAFHFFHDAANIPQAFWQQLLYTLKNHELYLENTWEVSQKPNNHYIADLVGHAYLSSFFGAMCKRTLQKLIGQWKYQVLPDGTSYEGSTQYHTLLTEMMMHFLLVCKYTNISLPPQLEQTYADMKQFLAHCTQDDGTLVLIGDNDSGKIVAGLNLPVTTKKNTSVTTYPNFGLSIIRTNGWHITFRHPTYQLHQPTGHFHQDMLSVTVGINNIPIIVDPGTYLYTANAQWRNRLRSAKSHNTFFLDDTLPMPSDLFQLNCLQHQTAEQTIHETEKITVHDVHHYYRDYGLIAHRTLTLTEKNSTLIITDWWERITDRPKKKSSLTVWALHFAQGITLEQKSPTVWYVKRFHQRLAMITTTLSYTAKQGWVCSEYGSITPSMTLMTSYPQTDSQQSIIIKKL